ncbi:hypothetical protein [Spiroplasma culicicola]|uniref:Uncharacterized protein n=1 Tax=Spiroplasma culicicola AES-1 TaxID=1276246 RepID=W6A7T4_9MOLU|nr:hypothetical protein [Spiroplasma culicicola]AHI53052.1 hypothetical protein SCULI_v1c07110 [Spiroplasma culicicola AES-1]
MGFDNNRGQDRQRRSFSSNRPSGGAGQNNGRIENFEKPLIELLKQINDKLDILIEKTK